MVHGLQGIQETFRVSTKKNPLSEKKYVVCPFHCVDICRDGAKAVLGKAVDVLA